jgi:hypothetical protein
MNREVAIERAACRKLLSLGIRAVKFVAPSETGYPDRIVFIEGGKPLLIEFKSPGEALRPKQAYIARQLQLLGYMVTKCESVKGTLNALADATNKGHVKREYR